MELDIRKLNAQRKYTGSFEFDYVPEKNLCLVPLCAIDGAVKVSGEYKTYEDDSVDISLDVKYRLKGQCSYCLEPAEKCVEYSCDVMFVTEDDGENYYYDGIKLVLNSAADDAILMSQPSVVLCREDCKGIDVPK